MCIDRPHLNVLVLIKSECHNSVQHLAADVVDKQLELRWLQFHLLSHELPHEMHKWLCIHQNCTIWQQLGVKCCRSRRVSHDYQMTPPAGQFNYSTANFYIWIKWNNQFTLGMRMLVRTRLLSARRAFPCVKRFGHRRVWISSLFVREVVGVT